jgi:two-component system response regulator AtoC
VSRVHALRAQRLGDAVMPHLIMYRWPGNIRELENLIERKLVLARADLIVEEDPPREIRQTQSHTGALWLELPDGGISLEGVERELILRALERCNGNQTQAAKYLDISRRMLIYEWKNINWCKRAIDTALLFVGRRFLLPLLHDLRHQSNRFV